MRTNYPFCPCYAIDCPYIGKHGVCMMYKEEGVAPYKECDEFFGLEEDEIDYYDGIEEE